MIRATTLWWTGLAIAVGMALFLMKYEVQALEDRRAELYRQIEADHQSIHVLRAEWTYLNDPQRLMELSEKHLAMAPIPPQRMVTLSALPWREDGRTEDRSAPGMTELPGAESPKVPVPGRKPLSPFARFWPELASLRTPQ